MSSLSARRKISIVALAALAVLSYVSYSHSVHEQLQPYLWTPKPQADVKPIISPAIDCPPADRLPAELPPPQIIQQPPVKHDWTTFHQISSIRHAKSGQPDEMPRSSDGALSGKGHRESFRTNLRNDTNYMISFPSFGFTNQFICIYVAIYMAHMTGRVPILQPFFPHYHQLHGHAPQLPIGEVYDLNRLRAVLDLPMVEMWELKDAPLIHNTSDASIEEPAGVDDIGCWSMWLAAHGSNFATNSPYGFRTHFTPIPDYALAAGIMQVNVLDVVQLLQPRPINVPFTLPPGSQNILTKFNISAPEILPEDHVACLDVTMFMLDQPERWDVTGEWVSGNGAWQAVGRHMRFQPRLLDIAEGYLRRTFNVPENESIPPYVGVHIRRTDFAPGWQALTLEDYAHAASVVADNIRTYLGVPVKNFLLLTDESNPEWLAKVEELHGWKFMNHETQKTMETYGPWHATLLDTVFMSGGIGFVGLRQSTMAIMAAHRVKEWNAGVAKFLAQDYHSYVPEDWVWPIYT